MKKKIVVYVTAPNMETAEKIARGIVTSRLAACANIIPGITSIYHWKDQIEEDEELLLLFKTTDDLFEKLEKKVLDLHTYEVPEIVAVTLERGHAPYLDWIEKETI